MERESYLIKKEVHVPVALWVVHPSKGWVAIRRTETRICKTGVWKNATKTRDEGRSLIRLHIPEDGITRLRLF